MFIACHPTFCFLELSNRQERCDSKDTCIAEEEGICVVDRIGSNPMKDILSQRVFTQIPSSTPSCNQKSIVAVDSMCCGVM